MSTRSLARTAVIGVVATSILLLAPRSVETAPPPVQPAAATARTPYRLVVADTNIAGGQHNHGRIRALDRVLDLVRERRLDVVTLQEVCRSQYDALRTRAATRGWHFAFYPQRTRNPDCLYGSDSRRFGTVIASPWPLRVHEPIDLPGDDGKRDFAMLCADLDVAGRAPRAAMVCTVHLRAFGGTEAVRLRAEQTAKIRDRLRTPARDRAVVLAGDFNSAPQRAAMTNIYRLPTSPDRPARGDFHESDETDKAYFDTARPPAECEPTACRSGEWTHRNRDGRWAHKLDYVFFSASAVRDPDQVTAVRRVSRYSDHGILIAQADLMLEPDPA